MDDEYQKEMEMREKTKASLQHSNQLADSLIESSREVLLRLQQQRELISGIRNRLIDLGSAIGMSDQIMRTIERRMTQDKWIVYGGMVGILLLIFVLYYYF